MFIHRSLHSPVSSRNVIFKYMTMFFLGASCVVLLTQGFNITTSLANTIQYMGKIILTDNGSNQNAITGIVLDGSNGSASFKGNVGIGTGTSNTYALNVSGNALFKNDITIHNDTNPQLILDSNNNTFSLMNNINSVAVDLRSSDNDFYFFVADTNPTMIITPDSTIMKKRVGIGVAPTAESLELSGNIKFTKAGRLGFSTNQLSLGVNGNIGIGTGVSNSYALNISGNTLVSKDLFVQGSGSVLGNFDVTKDLSVQGSGHIIGNVGIGTGIPSEKLEINGNIKLSTGGWIGTIANQISLGVNENVGINSPANNHALTVNGEIRTNNAIHANSGLFLGGPDNASANINTLGGGGGRSELNLGGEESSFGMNSYGNFFIDNTSAMGIDANGIYLPGSPKSIRTDPGQSLSLLPMDYSSFGGTNGGNVYIKGGKGQSQQQDANSSPGGVGGSILIYGGLGGTGNSQDQWDPYPVAPNGNILLAWNGASAIGKVGIGTNILSSALTVSGNIETTAGRKIKTDVVQMTDSYTISPCDASRHGEIRYTSSQLCTDQNDHGCLVYCTYTGMNNYVWRVISHE